MTDLKKDALLQFSLAKLQKINGRLGIKGHCKVCKAEFVGFMQNGGLNWEGGHASTCQGAEQKATDGAA